MTEKDMFIRLANGDQIENYDVMVPDEEKLENFSLEEKVQYYMLQISKQVFDFISAIAIDIEAEDILSVRLQGNGEIYSIELCNGETKVIVGKNYTYKDFLEMSATKALEHEINVVVRKMYALTKDKQPQEETYWI